VIVNVHSLNEVKAVLDGFGGWDNYVPDKILEAMTTIWPEVSSVQMGVEGSPVIYIQIPLWLSQIRRNEAKHQITHEQALEHNLYVIGEGDESIEELGKRTAAFTGNRRLTEDERKEIMSMVYKAFNCWVEERPDDRSGPTEFDYEEGSHRFPAISFSIRLWWD